MTFNPKNGEKPHSVILVVALLLITVLWGSTFVFMKILLDYKLPGSFIALCRFFSAGLIFFIVFYKKILSTLKQKPIINGIIIGIINGTALVVQLVGLEHTKAANSAFITTTYVVFIPLLELVLYKKRISGWIITSIFIALTGTYLLSVNDFSTFSFNKGDLITVVCGAIYALQIVFISHFTKEENVYTLVFTQFIVSGLVGLVVFIFSGVLQNVDSLIAVLSIKEVLINLIVLSTIATFIPFSLQFYFQQHVSSTIAGMAYLAEPVFALFLSILVLGEVLTPQSIFGIVLIFFGILVISYKDK